MLQRSLLLFRVGEGGKRGAKIRGDEKKDKEIKREEKSRVEGGVTICRLR